MGQASPKGADMTTGTILFKVTHPKSQQISYLFGTHHAFGKSFFDTLTPANKALASCNVLIKENLNLPGHEAQDIINARSSTTSWKSYLNKDHLDFVNTLFANSPTNYHKMTPTELYVFLNRHFKEQVCLNKDGTDTHLSLDDYIGSIAEDLQLKLIGLETTEAQIALINKDVEGMPKKVHKKRLANIINMLKTQNPNNCQETDWYRQMDIDYHYDIPCQNSLILTNRNEAWLASITPLLETNNCFIAVGLSHLMYQCSLIVQLQNLGYSITPILLK
ncbi:TraB/GumN family protein [Mangrovimonas sp. YM274]|uniref:TraB/GumN family protein n=1 Tax=Mangrovimonas sp. YM274 TaxID=3070660 RepID=UPI0027DB556C|nr:TraB/GumN family protein [Mangrovimonas sp. YM274]WMI69007.1 TraB/GumN family protein [Mangrovimonas sp. YM274]